MGPANGVGWADERARAVLTGKASDTTLNIILRSLSELREDPDEAALVLHTVKVAVQMFVTRAWPMCSMTSCTSSCDEVEGGSRV